jgi:hypothetical protein
MILFASVIVFAFVLAFASGGRLSRFEGVHVRWWGLALAGLAVQFVPLPEGAGGTDLLVRTIVLAASYLALLAFAAINMHLPGVALILTGLALNAIVITANGGMPVSASALRSSDQTDVLAQLERSGADKHHLRTNADVLVFLGDVVPIPAPIAQVVSIGDVLVYAGLMWFVVAAMRGRTPPARSRAWAGYRGRHRLESGASPSKMTPLPPAPVPAPPGATTSGTEP